jgi:hypothetical protein
MLRACLIPSFILLVTASAPRKNNVVPPSPIDFYQEEITLAVNDSLAQITGIYHFRNNTEKNTPFTVAFPFYVDSASLYPHWIKAFVVDGNDTTDLIIKILSSRNAVALSVPMTPGKITTWHLDYAQKIRTPMARYILTTTGSWGKPLEQATYAFIVPATFDSVTTWPEADSVITEGNSNKHITHRTNFMPTTDMQVRWKPR